MENVNLINKPMAQDEALKILNLEGKELTPELIMKVFILFLKNQDNIEIIGTFDSLWEK